MGGDNIENLLFLFASFRRKVRSSLAKCCKDVGSMFRRPAEVLTYRGSARNLCGDITQKLNSASSPH